MEQKIQINKTQNDYLIAFAQQCYSYYFSFGPDEISQTLFLYAAKSAQYVFQKSRRNKLLNIINLKMKPGTDPGYDFEYYTGKKVKVVPFFNFKNKYASYSGPFEAADIIAIVAFDAHKMRGQILAEINAKDLIKIGAIEAIDENSRKIDVQKVFNEVAKNA